MTGEEFETDWDESQAQFAFRYDLASGGRASLL
jgi:hypothetical protein